LNNLTKRTLSGIGFILVILGALTGGPLTFYILFLVITGFCLLEFYNLAVKNGADVQKTTGIITGLVIFSVNFLVTGGYIENTWWLIVLPFIFLIHIRELYRNKKNPFRNITYTLAGLIYPLLFLTLISQIVFIPYPDPGYNHQIILSLFVLTWSHDSFAYIVGKRFGKHKLSRNISPQKSWEGVAGGFFFTILAALIIFYLTSHLNMVIWIVLAIIVSVAGTFGDLTVSSVKRSAGVKESGHLIPGHGGALDRFDSALFIIPLAYAFLKLIL